MLLATILSVDVVDYLTFTAFFAICALPFSPLGERLTMQTHGPVNARARAKDEGVGAVTPSGDEDEDDSAYAEARYRQYAYHSRQLRLSALRAVHDRRDLEALIPGVPCLRHPVDGGKQEGRLFQPVMTQ